MMRFLSCLVNFMVRGISVSVLEDVFNGSSMLDWNSLCFHYRLIGHPRADGSVRSSYSLDFWILVSLPSGLVLALA